MYLGGVGRADEIHGSAHTFDHWRKGGVRTGEERREQYRGETHSFQESLQSVASAPFVYA